MNNNVAAGAPELPWASIFTFCLSHAEEHLRRPSAELELGEVWGAEGLSPDSMCRARVCTYI